VFVYIQVFLFKFKNVIFGNDVPYTQKATEVLEMVVTQLLAKFRRRTTRRLGGVWKQKK